MDTEFAYSFDSIKAMLDDIGVSEEDQAQLYHTYEPPRIQRHAAYTLFARRFQDVRNPVAWFKASLRGNWNAPSGFDAEQQVMHFRIDEATWAQMQAYIPCAICGRDHAEKDCP